MLNLSTTRVDEQVSRFDLASLKRIELPNGQHMFRIWVAVAIVISIGVLFLPWVQNFRAKGSVTALDPASRPQTVHSTIPGRIEQWFVFEGDTVAAGDTITRLSETKPEYLDPQLVERTGQTRDAKANSADGYLLKAEALSQQAANARAEQGLKLRTARNKLDQARLYVETLDAELAQQRIEVEVADYQLSAPTASTAGASSPLPIRRPSDSRHRRHARSLTATLNKLDQAKTDVAQAQLAIDNIGPEYAGKLAKIESDRQSALTDYYTAIGDVAKLSSQETNYRLRRGYNYIVAPQSGIIAKVLTPGLGETVKEGEAVVSILPTTFRAAVEIYVEPFNLPLVRVGQEVRFLFDGWPAVVFSGWPGLSYGTFIGEVQAIDNIIDSKGRYRVLVAPNDKSREWPEALRPGSGAEGVALLNRVPVWYELWRQLNAFPPDYYDRDEVDKDKDGLKLKAPAKTLVK